MNIQYFFRHPHVGHSIHRVFRTIIKEISKTQETDIIEVPNAGSMPWDVIKNNLFVFNHRKQHTIHHVTGHIHDVLMALIGVKTVLTIHDLVFLDNVKNPIKRFYKWLFWLYIPIKIADKVVCISTQTKHNILSKITTDKLVVIHNPVDPAFNFSEKPFNQEMPIILHIGTGWNKNLEKTIQALAGINCHLRIIGKLSSTQFKLLNDFNINFSNQCNLSDSEIKQEYTNCDIVNFPSKYEGFGMPIIEGQCTGRIVVTSNIEPIIEVANGAAVFISPEDVNSITTAYTKIIADEAYRIDIINRGLINCERFRVESITQQYLELYKKIIKE